MAALMIVFAATEIFKKPELPDVTEIEILSSPASLGGGQPASIPAAEPGAAAPSVALSTPEDVIVKAEPVKAPAPLAKALPVAVRQDASPKASPQAAQQTPRHQQVAAPNFETAQLEEAPAIETPAFDEGMIAEDLAFAEQEDRKQAQAQAKALKAEAEEQESQITAAQAKELAKVEKKNQEEAQRMAEIATEQRQQEKVALAQALAKEKQEQDAKNRAAAAAALAAVGPEQGEGSGQGAQAQATVGAGSGIRGIQDLQQMPGNKRPEYESEDRLQGRQGQVVFTAYVTKEGMLTDFKILKTSGHRNLDLKTLKALKQWKFIPGQEGMVEIPFQWDLKGGPQEMSGGLRTKVSQGQRPAELRNSSTETKF